MHAAACTLNATLKGPAAAARDAAKPATIGISASAALSENNPTPDLGSRPRFHPRKDRGAGIAERRHLGRRYLLSGGSPALLTRPSYAQQRNSEPPALLVSIRSARSLCKTLDVPEGVLRDLEKPAGACVRRLR